MTELLLLRASGAILIATGFLDVAVVGGSISTKDLGDPNRLGEIRADDARGPGTGFIMRAVAFLGVGTT